MNKTRQSPTPRSAAAPSLLSLVCPAYNEAANVVELHRRVSAAIPAGVSSYELVFVDDGSTDDTSQVLHNLRDKHPEIAIVELSRNFGKEIAIAAGLDFAKGDVVALLDADLQHPPELLGALLEQWRRGYDVVYTVRSSRDDEGPVKRGLTSVFYRLLGSFGDSPPPEPNASDFRLLSRNAVDAVNAMRERHRFMKGIFAWIGYPSMAVPYVPDVRFAGKTKWNFRSLTRLSVEGLTSHTIAPLRWSAYLGLVTAASAFVYGFYFLVKAVLYGDPVAGFPTLVILILMLGGVQLTVLGVIGEYLGRIFNETKRRPLYLVRRSTASQVDATPTDVKELGQESEAQ